MRQVAICGAILVLGYIVLFCLLQSRAFWYDLRPDPIRSLFPDLFGPINQLFPDRWVNLNGTENFALIAVPIYLAMVALVTGPLLYLLRRLSRRGVVSRAQSKRVVLVIFAFTLVILLALLFVRGLLSSDIYNYVWYSRIVVLHGASPYTHVPADFPPDPEGSIYWIGWAKEPAVYGPAWLAISSLFFKLGQLLGGSFSAQLLSLRVLADGAHLLNGWLVWSIAGLILARHGRIPVRAQRRIDRIARSLGLRRSGSHAGPYQSARAARNSYGLQLAAMLFYLWNPITLVEFGASGHNDVVMLTFVLLAVWLYLKGWWRAAALALGLATLVKISAIIFVPGYLWLLLWQGVRDARGRSRIEGMVQGGGRAAQASAIMLAAWVALYLPFWEGLQTLKPLVSGPSTRMYLHSLPAMIWWVAAEPLANFLGSGATHDQTTDSIRQFLGDNLKLIFLGLLIVVAVWVTWRARTFGRMLTAWGWVALATVMVQAWFWPWYVSWVLVPATIAPSKRLRTGALIFSISALLNYLEEQILAPHFKLFSNWSGLCIMCPPLLYLVVSWQMEGRRKRKARRALALGTNRSTGISMAEPVG